MLYLLRRGRGPAALVAAVAVLACATSAAAESPQPTGRLLASLEQPGAKPIERVLDRTGLRATQSVPGAGVVSISPLPREGLADLRARLLADPGVARVDTEYYRQVRYVPNDPLYATTDNRAPAQDKVQWNLRRQNFEAAWDLSTGAGAKVAIVDTGVTNTHGDLIANVLPGDDQDVTPTGQRSDENGHGTHVSGLACADSDNGYGLASAGFDCRIIPEKLDVNGDDLTDASVIAGIHAAVARDADVINLSLGGPGPNAALRTEINDAWAAGTVIVAAAKNPTYSGGVLTPAGTDQGYPARYVVPNGSGPNPATCADGDASAVGCSRGLVVTMAQYDDRNAGSGTGSGISIAAYGDSMAPLPGILSTFPATTTTLEQSAPGGATCLATSPPCRPRTQFSGDDDFAYLFGTSMATPQVSGLAALIRSAAPGLSAGAVVQAIRRTASNCGAWEPQLGFGIIDAGRAVASATGRDVTAPSSKASGPRRTKRRAFRIAIDRSDPAAAACGGISAGIDNVSIFVARGKGPFRLLEKTGKASVEFRGRRGRRYRFYTRALDNAGNHEADRGAADLTVRINKRKNRKRR